MAAVVVDRNAENFKLFGFILEEELATGFLLASLGEQNTSTNKQNYYIVDASTPYKSLKEKFLKLYFRKDIAIILLSSDVEQKLTSVLSRASRFLPIVVIVPSRQNIEKMAQAGQRRRTEALADVVAQFNAR